MKITSTDNTFQNQVVTEHTSVTYTTVVSHIQSGKVTIISSANKSIQRAQGVHVDIRG